MKRIIPVLFAVIVVILTLSGCASMHGAEAPAGPPKDLFVGKWTISDISYTNLVEGAVQTVFDQAPPKDFIGSTWDLTNSGNGSYTLTNGTSQNIYWSVNGGDALGAIFQFKKVNQGQSPKDVKVGYQLVISKNMGTYMILKTLVFTGNKNGYVVYTFNKVKG